jgi:GntR family transcriptional regulator of vanillate catabolism
MGRARSEKMTQYARALLTLRRLVLNGEFAANSRLPETALAERLGISRTPLRQAMARLVDEGLLEQLDTGGCRVASFSMEDIIDAIEIRGVLEGTAARLAAERGPDPELLDKCRDVLDGLDDAVFGSNRPDFSRYVELNAQFHDLISALSGSRVIRREVKRASRLPLASPSAFLQGQEIVPDFQASLKHAQLQHRAILEAILKCEGARAEALCREHARLARRNLDYVRNSDPSLAERVPGMALVTT